MQEHFLPYIKKMCWYNSKNNMKGKLYKVTYLSCCYRIKMYHKSGPCTTIKTKKKNNRDIQVSTCIEYLNTKSSSFKYDYLYIYISYLEFLT